MTHVKISTRLSKARTKLAIDEKLAFASLHSFEEVTAENSAFGGTDPLVSLPSLWGDGEGTLSFC